jgi:hypothetical protein
MKGKNISFAMQQNISSYLWLSSLFNTDERIKQYL